MSDADGVQELDDKQRDLNNRWCNLTINLQRQRTLQEKLATAWNKFNFDLGAADTHLSELEEQANRIDKTVRSKQQLLENGNHIQVCYKLFKCQVRKILEPICINLINQILIHRQNLVVRMSTPHVFLAILFL